LHGLRCFDAPRPPPPHTRAATPPPPLQAKTLDYVVDGNDLVGRARTGCGKTLAFVLPVVQALLTDNSGAVKRAFGRKPSVLVLAPTRELAKQVRRGPHTVRMHPQQAATAPRP